ncbi:MAG TPA: hypothetical protein VNO26_13400 [Candidatus Limnocylindria bacterium]|nr:hypothetical protein [Candidatus Limnocylindria bacterium]
MNDGTRRCGQLAVILAVLVVGGRAAAMTYRPLSDENLVAASGLVVIGRVEQVRSARLPGGRIVTQADLVVDTTLKGPAHRRIRVTEAGGRVGDVTVRIPGMPRFVAGERMLVFLRERPDGTLGTTALSLAAYTVTGATPALARRTAPAFDERRLDAFERRIRALAAGAAAASVSDGFGGAAAVEVDVRTDGFTLLGNAGDCDPAVFAGCIGGRWHEARCGEAIVYDTSNADETLRAVVQAGLDAWSSVPGAQLALVLGDDVPAVPSALGVVSSADFENFDGRNVVQFDDPFEIVPDLVECQGVLALGGTVSTPEGRIVENETSYDRTLEGDVVVNQGAGACLGEGGLAETVAHEIGHTLGFGHTSENPAEPVAALREALMYFLIHDDGRGAALGAEDIAGMQFVYAPPASEPTPAGSALRDAACLVGINLWSSACFLDQERLGGFPRVLLKKSARAAKAARKAYAARKPKKQMRLLGKADRQLGKAETKLLAFTADGTLRPECGSGLQAQLDRERARIGDAILLVAGGS